MASAGEPGCAGVAAAAAPGATGAPEVTGSAAAAEGVAVGLITVAASALGETAAAAVEAAPRPADGARGPVVEAAAGSLVSGFGAASPCSTVLICPGVLATTSGSAILAGSMATTKDCGERRSVPATPSVSSTPPVANRLFGHQHPVAARLRLGDPEQGAVGKHLHLCPRLGAAGDHQRTVGFGPDQPETRIGGNGRGRLGSRRRRNRVLARRSWRDGRGRLGDDRRADQGRNGNRSDSRLGAFGRLCRSARDIGRLRRDCDRRGRRRPGGSDFRCCRRGVRTYR